MDELTAATVEDAIEAVTERLGDKLKDVHVMRLVGSDDDERAGRHLVTARATVGAYLGTPATVAGVPLDLLAHATLLVASQLWHAEDAPHGVANWADDTGTPVRVARDPLTVARPILGRFVGLGIG